MNFSRVRKSRGAMPLSFGGHNLPPMVEIGSTDLPKSWGAPPSTTGLRSEQAYFTEKSLLTRRFNVI